MAPSRSLFSPWANSYFYIKCWKDVPKILGHVIDRLYKLPFNMQKRPLE